MTSAVVIKNIYCIGNGWPKQPLRTRECFIRCRREQPTRGRSVESESIDQFRNAPGDCMTVIFISRTSECILAEVCILDNPQLRRRSDTLPESARARCFCAESRWPCFTTGKFSSQADISQQISSMLSTLHPSYCLIHSDRAQQKHHHSWLHCWACRLYAHVPETRRVQMLFAHAAQ